MIQSGRSMRRAGLFWFCISPLFTYPEKGSPLARYLDKPEAVLDPIWPCLIAPCTP